MQYILLSPDIIKENCRFTFYFNKSDITPTVLDGGNEIILANWPSDKHIIYNARNYIQVKNPSHNISVLCNCGIEAENNFF